MPSSDYKPASSISRSSDYAPYPSLTQDDLGPLPDLQYETEPMTPPPTPVTRNLASLIDSAFDAAVRQDRGPEYLTSHVADAFSGSDNKKNRTWIPKNNTVLFYLVIFGLGVLFGMFAAS